MKLPELKIIYGINIFILIMSILVVLLTDETIEQYIYGITGFISLVIIYGLKERNDFIRKLTIYYFGLGAFINIIQILIITPYVVIFTENNIEVFGFILTIVTFTAYIFIIRALVNEPLLSEFTSNNSLKKDQ